MYTSIETYLGVIVRLVYSLFDSSLATREYFIRTANQTSGTIGTCIYLIGVLFGSVTFPFCTSF